MVGELVQGCRSEGIEAIAYYSVRFDNLAFSNHPSWRVRAIDGKERRCQGFSGEEKWGPPFWVRLSEREERVLQLKALGRTFF